MNPTAPIFSSQKQGLTTIPVDGASVTPTRDGSFLLLLNTGIGTVRFSLSHSIGRAIFIPTNQPASDAINRSDKALLARKPYPDKVARATARERFAAARAEWLDHPSLSLALVAEHHHLGHPSSLRQNLVKHLGIDAYRRAAAVRGKPAKRRRLMPLV